jgi:hypothetical protein
VGLIELRDTLRCGALGLCCSQDYICHCHEQRRLRDDDVAVGMVTERGAVGAVRARKH